MVPVTAPEQLSVAVGGVSVVIEQLDVKVDKLAASGTGAVLSPITTFWFCVVEFPAASVNVQTTVVDCVIGKVVVVVPVITPLQLSFAVGTANEETGLQVEVTVFRLGKLGTGAVRSLITTLCV